MKETSPPSLEYATTDARPASRPAKWAFGLALASLILLPFWEAILRLLRHANFFTISLPYPTIEYLTMAICVGPTIVVPWLAYRGWIDTSKRHNCKPGRPYVIAALATLPMAWFVLNITTGLGHDRHAMGRETNQRRTSQLASTISRFAVARGRYPGDFAEATAFNPEAQFDLGFNTFSGARRDLPVPLDHPDPSSPTYARELAEWADWHYLGERLPTAPPEPDQLVLLVSRFIHGHRNLVHVDYFQRAYTYDHEARVVAFASGRVALIPTRDLPHVIAESNHVRAGLGLPPHPPLP